MKMAQHIAVAMKTYKDIESINKSRLIYEIAYAIGSIAPDLNCMYPAHRLHDTCKRFQRKVEKLDRQGDRRGDNRGTILRAFRLGTLTHYICDYCCYAHSNESTGRIHIKYEMGLFKRFLRTRGNRAVAGIDWHNIEERVGRRIGNEKNEHPNKVMAYLEEVDRVYRAASERLHIHGDWINSIEQWDIDICYAFEVSRKILPMIDDASSMDKGFRAGRVGMVPARVA